MNNLQHALSPERLSTFVNMSKTLNFPGGIELYKYNLEMSQALYPLLSCLEVTLRNQIHSGMSKRWGQDWLISGKVSFYVEEKAKIEKAKASLRNVTVPKIVAELNFGFWTSMLSSRYSELYTSKILKEIFLSRPSTSLKIARPRLNEIRKLRNRIFHYEPVINLKNPDIFVMFKDCLECLEWMSEDTNKWLVDSFSEIKNFEEKFRIIKDKI